MNACGITPSVLRTPSGSVRTSCPPIRAVPEVGDSSVVIMRISVVFPAPFGPSRPKISCGDTLKLMSFTATKSPNFLPCDPLQSHSYCLLFIAPAQSSALSRRPSLRKGTACLPRRSLATRHHQRGVAIPQRILSFSLCRRD